MLLNSAILLHVPALYFIDYCQLFYDTRMVWTFKIFTNVPLWQAILFSWFIALVEYSFMIPATRMLSQQGWSMGEMKITQEVVTLLVFVPFMLFLFKQPFKLDYLWAGLCLFGCVYFVFRSQ